MPTETLQRDMFFQSFNKRYGALTFDDVSIEPRRSSVVPRDVSLETWLTPDIPLHIPLVSADMDTVTEAELAIKLAMEGGLGFLWKSPDVNEQVGWVRTTKSAFNKLIDAPLTILETQTKKELKEALAKAKNRFSTAVVLNSNGKVVGLVTKDETRFAKENYIIRDFMVRDPITTNRRMDVQQAYDFMTKHKTGKLIVVSKTGNLRGLYTFKDVTEIVEGATPLFNRDKDGRLRVGANVGVFDDKKSRERFVERASRLLEARCDVILVGTAHGDTDNVIRSVRLLRKEFKRYNFGLVAGNVVTYDGAIDLLNAGADTVKIGLGAGSICTTRVVAGIGVPQLTAVYNCARAAAKKGGKSISDGGIRYSGDIVKVLAAGADTVMLGSLFAATEESAGDIINTKKGRYKEIRGMGSIGAMKENQSSDRYGQKGAEKLVPEGVEGMVPLNGSASEVIYQLTGGIRAGMGYVGARTIRELGERARFIGLTPAGRTESHPHDIEMTAEAPNYIR